MTDRMSYFIVSLRIVMAMFGFNVGLTYASFVFDRMSYVSLFCTFVCACAWYAVERQIKREQNDTY